MKERAYEVNFDGLVGPTHNYAGLSTGNLASMAYGQTVSHPKEAALQGLGKMKLLLDMGLKQGVFPPQDRPDFETLRRLGFYGSDAEVLERARRQAPVILAACWSASSMWAANAATVSPGADTDDGKVHITPANLLSQFHRSLESPFTARLLKIIFPDETVFAHHPPLPACLQYADEGAANHTRLCRTHAEPGVEIFVYGKGSSDPPRTLPRRHPARQAKETSVLIARMHQLSPERTVFARQNAEVIDAGVFHNDVIAVGNTRVFLYHAQAFTEGAAVVDELKEKFSRCSGDELALIEIGPDRLSLMEAVETYFFNSQLVSLPEGAMCLIAPTECEQNENAGKILEEIVQDNNPIQTVRFVDIRQSMLNGGGGACLRLRVALTESEIARIHPSALLTDQRYDELVDWVERHYRDRLHPDDLADPSLAEESRSALDELTRILKLGAIYRFQ